ncbi:MAG: M28 family peptidase [Dehalococcoidia bacterium]
MATIGPRWLLAAVLAAGVVFGVACSDDSGGSVAVESPPASPAQGTPAATPPTTGGAPSQPSATPALGSQPNAEPDANRAFSHIQKLADEIGDRASGTPDEHAAAEYIAGTLRSYGFEVEMQRFPVSVFLSRSVSLSVESPQQRSYTVQPLTNSQGGMATGEMVYAGIGSPSDFTDAVRGKVVLVERGELTHQQKATSAAQAGALALVIFNNQDELFLGQLNMNSPDIPVLSMSGTDGRALRDLVRAGGVRASVAFDGGRSDSESINVVARSPGTRCEVMLGGHYDSVPGAPGASDNASGTAAVIEMARVQALRGNPEHACFAAFGSEETGLDGSRYYVESLSTEDRQVMRFMLNFDMVAVGSEWLLIGTQSLQEQGQQIMSGMGLASRFIVPLGFSSDYASFMNAGIPSLFLHRSDDPLLHTPADASDRISIDQLGESMRIGLAFLEGINPA